MLGALWSYGVLGWGGYWAWDPVENVALLPWLVATAFLHSVMIQERRGMLKVWNLSLVVGAFALTTFGTFLTRGSILSSVHAFAQIAVGPLYLGFLVLVLAAGFGLIAWRVLAPAHRGPVRFGAVPRGRVPRQQPAAAGDHAGRPAGHDLPAGRRGLTNRQVTVGGPYFDQTTVPVFLLLLFLVGIGPLLPWRRATGEQIRRRAAVPAVGRRGDGCGPGARRRCGTWSAVLAFGLGGRS